MIFLLLDAFMCIVIFFVLVVFMRMKMLFFCFCLLVWRLDVLCFLCFYSFFAFYAYKKHLSESHLFNVFMLLCFLCFLFFLFFLFLLFFSFFLCLWNYLNNLIYYTTNKHNQTLLIKQPIRNRQWTKQELHDVSVGT